MLALLVGCGLRRTELLALTVHQIEQREGRWIIPDLVGKGNRRRTEASRRQALPTHLKSRKLTGESIQDEKGIWHIVVQ